VTGGVAEGPAGSGHDFGRGRSLLRCDFVGDGEEGGVDGTRIV
jgi:hypothetical protein